MQNDFILTKIQQDLTNKHGCHTVILYGSRARGEANVQSDYDIIAIREEGGFARDCRLFEGFYLDIFIYDEESVKNIDASFLRVKDGIVLMQKNNMGDVLLSKVKTLYQAGAPTTPEWEKHEIQAWLHKMLARAKTNDVEGNFRRHWLLNDLLSCYFKLRDQWYLGPKESFKWRKENDLPTYDAFSIALMPDAEIEHVELLIQCVLNR